MPYIVDGNINVENGQVVLSNVLNCAITKSTLDMDMKNITNVKDPVFPQDAATKQYTDALSGVTTVVNLIGTTPVLFKNALLGSFTVSVYSLVDGNPQATYIISKASSFMKPNKHRVQSTPGYRSVCVIELTWDIGDGIRVYKTYQDDFDASYIVRCV